MHLRRLSIGALTGALLTAVTPAAAQGVASSLLNEGDAVPGLAGNTVDSINNTAVNGNGGFAVSINASDGLTTTSLVWGSAAGGAGAPLFLEGTFGDLEQTSWESFFGIAADGTVCYSPSTDNTATGQTGLDSVWANDTPVILEEDPFPGGEFWSFGSRPGCLADGTPVWVGGVTDTQGGPTRRRGLFRGFDEQVVLIGEQAVPGLPFPLDDGSSVDFDFRFSPDGSNYLTPVQMDSGSTSDDNAVVLNGAGLLVDGALVREDDPLPEAAGGLPGESWDNFDFIGINDAGGWLITGDSNGDSATDEFVLVNGVIAHREGDEIDGEAVSGSIEGAYLNADGDYAYIWDIGPAGELEALFLNDQLLLAEGDAVDFDGDGVVDANAIVSSFSGISSLTLGDRDARKNVAMYATVEVSVDGGSDVEGFYEIVAAADQTLDLTVGPLVRGDVATFDVCGADEGEEIRVIRSGDLGEGPCFPQFGGLCIDVVGAVSLVGSAIAGPDGCASFSVPLPGGAPLGPVAFQGAVQRGPGGADSVKTNAVLATIVDP